MEWQLNLHDVWSCGRQDSWNEKREKKIVSELKMLCKLDLTTLDVWAQHNQLTTMRTRASKIDFNFLHSHPIDSFLFFVSLTGPSQQCSELWNTFSTTSSVSFQAWKFRSGWLRLCVSSLEERLRDDERNSNCSTLISLNTRRRRAAPQRPANDSQKSN